MAIGVGLLFAILVNLIQGATSAGLAAAIAAGCLLVSIYLIVGPFYAHQLNARAALKRHREHGPGALYCLIAKEVAVANLLVVLAVVPVVTILLLNGLAIGLLPLVTLLVGFAIPQVLAGAFFGLTREWRVDRNGISIRRLGSECPTISWAEVVSARETAISQLILVRTQTGRTLWLPVRAFDADRVTLRLMRRLKERYLPSGSKKVDPQDVTDWSGPVAAAVIPLPDYRLDVTFSDGRRAVTDLSRFARSELSGPKMADQGFFARVTIIDGELIWPNGVSIEPVGLYDRMEANGELPERDIPTDCERAERGARRDERS